MKILIGGGTGFIGQALQHRLSEEGDEIVVVSRSAGPGKITWEELKKSGLPRCDAVINLAGASVMAKRWTETYKRELFSSRIDTAKIMANAISASDSPPKVWIQASAVAYYSTDFSLQQTEGNGPGSEFLSMLTQQWEAATKLPSSCPTRTVQIRIGVALDPKGGALQRMLPTFKAGLGGKIGSGRQPFAWIHLEDLVDLFVFALNNSQLVGPLNGVAPEQVTMGQFTKALGKALKRPTLLPVPMCLLKLMLGERASILGESPQVLPARALALGFTFKHPNLSEALADLI